MLTLQPCRYLWYHPDMTNNNNKGNTMTFFNNETETNVTLQRGETIALQDGTQVAIEAMDGMGHIWFTLNNRFQCVDFKTITKIA